MKHLGTFVPLAILLVAVEDIIATESRDCSVGNGGCDQVCTNTPEGAKCTCSEGFQLTSDLYCTDVNECHLHPSVLCSTNETCWNTHGSYRCLGDTVYDGIHKDTPGAFTFREAFVVVTVLMVFLVSLTAMIIFLFVDDTRKHRIAAWITSRQKSTPSFTRSTGEKKESEPDIYPLFTTAVHVPDCQVSSLHAENISGSCACESVA